MNGIRGRSSQYTTPGKDPFSEETSVCKKLI
jgi:hypothetical protein